MFPVKYLLLSAFILGTVWGQAEPSLQDAVDQLPPDLQNVVDEAQMETVKNKSAELFKEKCQKNGGADAFEKAESAFKEFPSCIQKLVDLNKLKEEIEPAKANGTVDEVFKKYCAKKQQFKNCFEGATDAAKPCLTAEERGNLKTVYNVTDQLAEFICFKDGDRIALFIAEGGPECFEEHRESIQECVNKTIGLSNQQMKMNDFTADSIPNITFGVKECGQMTALQKCVVGSLEKCSAPTSANIVESLFKFVRQATPCKNFDNDDVKPVKRTSDTKESKPGSANVLAVTGLTIIMAAATILA